MTNDQGDAPPFLGDWDAAPICRTLGFWPESRGEGEVTFAMDPSDRIANTLGVVHGGVAATLLDSAFGIAVATLLRGTGRSFATVDLRVSYLKRIATDGPRLRAYGRVIHLGRRIAFTEGTLHAGDTLAATGTATLAIVERR